MRYLHTMLRVRNLDAAMKFYQDALGLKEVRRVDSDKGKQIYSHRMSTVEPVFANITSCKQLKRFSLRGKTKVQGQHPKRFAGWALAIVLYDAQHRKADAIR